MFEGTARPIKKTVTIFGSDARKVFRLASLFAFCILLSACNLESDAKLKGVFDAHSEDFRQLAAMAEVDRKVGRILAQHDPPANSTVSTQRWQAYQALFQKLGLKEGMEHREDRPSGSFFLEECSGTAITHDCKGYVYSEIPLTPVQESLDGPPAKVAFRRIARNWYLFRDDG